jgi:hypothetical protein
MGRSRLAIAVALVALAVSSSAVLVLPGAAAAKSYSAHAGGVTATLSFTDGPGITTKNERLTITAPGMPTYDQPVPAQGCFKVCSPGNQPVVQVADLYGDGEYAVVLDLWSGGADCCGIEQVYVPSASIHSWVLSTRNFGNYGARLVSLSGHEVFLSGDNAFYCTFAACAASGLPIQIWSFTEDAFHNVTRSYPKLIAKDAAFWLKTYDKNISEGQGLIAAWAADEDELGLSATVRTVLQLQVADHHLTQRFVAQLEAFLQHHGYAH